MEQILKKYKPFNFFFLHRTEIYDWLFWVKNKLEKLYVTIYKIDIDA